MKFKTLEKGLLIVAVPMVLNLVLLIVFAYLLAQERLDTQSEIRAKELNDLCTDLFVRAGEPAMIVIRHATNPSDHEAPAKYARIRRKINKTFARLRELRLDATDKKVLNHLHDIQIRASKIIDALENIVQQGRDGMLFLGESQISYELEMLSSAYFSDLEKLQNKGIADQKKLHESSLKWKQALKNLIIAGLAGNVAVSIILSIFFSNSISQRIRRVRETVIRLEKFEESTIPKLDGSDEIAQLDQAYRDMSVTLKETRLRERTLVDNARDIICTLNRDLEISAVSPSVESVWGYASDEVIGRNLNELLVPDGSTLSSLMILSKSADPHGALEFENTVKHRNGTSVFMLWSARWSSDEEAFFCVAHDISGRKAIEEYYRESEERIRTVFETLPIASLILDDLGYIESANNKARELFDLADESSLLALRLMESALSKPQVLEGNHPAQQHISSFLLREISDAKEVVSALEQKYLNNMGKIDCHVGDHTVPAELLITELNFRDQRRLLAIIVDMSEYYQIEKARLELVSMISHDVRTPLTCLLVTAEMLVSGILGNLVESDATAIDSAVMKLERIISITNGLLDLEKMRAGMLKLDWEVNLFSEIVNCAIYDVTSKAQFLGVRLESQITDCELHCDKARLITAMTFMLDDAMTRFCNDEALYLEAFPREGFAVFRVKSTAASLSEETLDLVQNQPVAVVEKQLTAGGQLGLLIAHGIAQAHSGYLSVFEPQDFLLHSMLRIPLPQEDQHEEDESV